MKNGFSALGCAEKLNHDEFVLFTSENIILIYNVKTKSSNHFELEGKI